MLDDADERVALRLGVDTRPPTVPAPVEPGVDELLRIVANHASAAAAEDEARDADRSAAGEAAT